MDQSTYSGKLVEPLTPQQMADILSKLDHKPDAEKVYQMIAALASTVKVKVYKSKFLSEGMIIIGTSKTGPEIKPDIISEKK